LGLVFNTKDTKDTKVRNAIQQNTKFVKATNRRTGEQENRRSGDHEIRKKRLLLTL